VSVSNNRHLPESWVEVPLGALLVPAATINPAKCRVGHFAYVDIEALDNDVQRITSPKRIQSAKAPSRARLHLRSGDVLFSLVRPYLRNLAVVPPDLDGAVGSTAFFVCRPGDGVDSRYLLNFLRRDAFIASVTTYGNSPPAARDDEFQRLPVVIPPSGEQSRLADALDELFSDLDAGVAALTRVREKLKLYRASVLKAAVEGTLTAEWRAQHPYTESATELLKRILHERRRRWEEDQLAKFKAKGQEAPKDWKAKYKEPVAPSTANLPRLPDGWCWASVDRLTCEVRNGHSLKPDAASGVPILRISAVRPFALDMNDVRYLSGTASDYSESLVHSCDLLFTRYNGTRNLVGVCAIVPKINKVIVHPDKLIRARPLPAVAVPAFVALTANVGASRAFIEQRIRTTAGQAGVSGSDIKEMPIPLPPSAEQEAIVEAVEDQLSVIDHLEADLDAKLKNAQALRQAILRHAFTGQLVPQNPNDEPASELLKRIAAEREARTREYAGRKLGGARSRKRRASRGGRLPT